MKTKIVANIPKEVHIKDIYYDQVVEKAVIYKRKNSKGYAILTKINNEQVWAFVALDSMLISPCYKANNPVTCIKKVVEAGGREVLMFDSMIEAMKHIAEN